MVDAYAIGDPRWKDIKPVSLEELVNNVDGFSFEKILINPELIVNNKITWHFTNKENPIVIGEALFLGKMVGFEEEYYKEYYKSFLIRYFE